MTPSPSNPTCVAKVLKTVPVIMRTIITQMHDTRGPSVTVPQFRLLFFIIHHPESSLAHLAEFLALTPPAASRQVDALVRKNLVCRKTDPQDRRRIVISITPAGQALFDQARQQAHDHLAQRLASLSPEQQHAIAGAMDILEGVFSPVASPSPDTRSTR